ncbi:RNA 2',3'-cyclic phosphodiesterase [Lederbergia lenta]|uniref:RNA 2',3'-cyclic phosphodiesterase n=1 Tax=Lederbergia lenta TaxID=1467 RepID=A0A2X4W980_LEDLE|nr:RNA 2',3'-cyclic phosphodiesterase [Lederbergia lenta]MCM3113389.1 RNA 2',3'-cyclic phosphodiesterase [Lederbergia lenta]MEC2326466.1 RNA 2',3'-cyclic phosphodiesterase [Lederbergia lenta]SQI61217.1 2'-5' RNA ligase [Lederbergia lenta]
MSHYFFALSLSNDLKGKLQDVSKEMRVNLAFKNWVHPKDYHITLAFLGQANEEQLHEACKLSENALASIFTFSFELSKVGVFGLPKTPRILWMGTKESNPLDEVQKRVSLACTQAKFKLDERPFIPHITLARKWIGSDDFTLENTVLKKDLFNIEYEASEVALFRTHPHNTPKYEKVKSFKFLP